MFSQPFLKELAAKVEALELRSSVEVVVVVAPQSGSYRELDAQIGFLAAMLLLLVAIHSPWEFSEDMLLFWLVVGYAAATWLSSVWAGPRRLLSSAERRRKQVQNQAQSAFISKRTHATRERTGLLLYLSHFERLGVFVPDLGVEGKLSRATLNTLEAGWAQTRSNRDFEAAVLRDLETLVAPLADALPQSEDDENEISNEILIER